MQILCHCPKEINLNETSIKLLYEKFKYLNFQVLKCFKFDFKLYLPDFIFILFFLNIFLIILTEIYFDKNLKNLYNYCSNFINSKHKDNSNFENLTEQYFLYLNNNNQTDDNLTENRISRFQSSNVQQISYNININWEDKKEYNYYYLILIK